MLVIYITIFKLFIELIIYLIYRSQYDNINNRKALSSHPKAKDWPPQAIKALRQYLETSGEYAVYNASIEVLDRNIKKVLIFICYII